MRQIHPVVSLTELAHRLVAIVPGWDKADLVVARIVFVPTTRASNLLCLAGFAAGAVLSVLRHCREVGEVGREEVWKSCSQIDNVKWMAEVLCRESATSEHLTSWY